MCGVVDAGRSRSTFLRHDAYIQDHCLGYFHNYLLFYQLPNSNLFTHSMLFSREKPLVKSTPPGLSFIILFSDLLFQKPKNTLLYFFFTYFLCVLARSIYPISYNLIYLFTVEGLTTPLSRWVASICSLCRHHLHSVAWFCYWIDNLGFITKGNNCHSCAASSLPLWGNTNADLSHVTWIHFKTEFNKPDEFHQT